VAKVRVSALAKELGTDSKTLMAHLSALGGDKVGTMRGLCGDK